MSAHHRPDRTASNIRPSAAHRHHVGSPLLSRATASSNGPAAICHRSPLAPIASSVRAVGSADELLDALVADAQELAGVAQLTDALVRGTT
jgi:hypothetical protein